MTRKSQAQLYKKWKSSYFHRQFHFYFEPHPKEMRANLTSVIFGLHLYPKSCLKSERLSGIEALGVDARSLS